VIPKPKPQPPQSGALPQRVCSGILASTLVFSRLL
jgi:hypothetical protein